MAWLFPSLPVLAEETYEFDIVSQPLEQAVTAFSRLTRYQFFYTHPDMQQIPTNQVAGSFSADDALKVMLFGTGVNYRHANDNTVILYQGDDPDNDPLNPSDGDTAGNDPANDYAEEYSGFILEEVVVSARKRREPLQEAPLSVSAFSGEQLTLAQISSTQELSRVTPNLTFDSNAPTSGHNSAAQIFIRGIGQQEFLGVSDPGVGFYVDGVYYARTVSTVFDLADIEQVEILRGPQGTLFGRNTIGGAIAIQTRKPAHENDGSLSLKTGTDNLREAGFAWGGGLSQQLAARLSLGSKKRDGYVQRLLTNSELGDDDRIHGRLGLAWTPRDDFNIFLGFDYLDRDEQGAPLVFGGVNLNAPLPSAVQFTHQQSGCPDATNLNDPRCWNNQYAAGEFANNGTFATESRLQHWGINLTAVWDISSHFRVKSITAYRALQADASRDADNTPLQGFHSRLGDDQEQLSQEFQLLGSSPDQRLDWILGLYYFEEQIDNNQALFFGLDQSLQLDFEADNQAYALFGQFTYDLSAALSATFGLRYTDEEKIILPDQRTTGPVGFNGLAPDSFFVDRQRSAVDFDDLSFVSSLAYRWSKHIMTYLSYSEGFKSGGFNARNVNLAGTGSLSTFDPENAKNWELGFKSELFNKRLRLNAALFHTDYSDLHVTVRLGIAPTVFNGGEATIQGFELEWAWVPTENWLITGGIGHIDAGYDRIEASLSQIPGADIGVDENDQLALTPRYSANLGLAYTYAFDNWVLTPQLGWSYTSEKFFDAENNPSSRQGDVNLLNASVALNSIDDHWGLVLALSNLSDEIYKTAVTDASNTGLAYIEEVYARGREWSLQLKYNW